MTSQLKFKFREKMPGYTLEVEFTGNEIDSIMEQYFEAMPKLHETIQERLPELRKLRITSSLRKRITCREVLLRLVSEGYFDELRTMPQTCNEVRKSGFHYDRSSVSHALKELCRERVLVKSGSKRKFQFQRTLS